MTLILAILAALSLTAPPPNVSTPEVRPSKQEMAARCREGMACGMNGECTFAPNRAQPDDDPCVIGGPADCASSLSCAEEGLCKWDARTRTCVLNGLRGCQRSLACSLLGLCGYRAWQLTEGGRFPDRRCVATAAGCAASFACRNDGKCGFEESLEECSFESPTIPTQYPKPGLPPIADHIGVLSGPLKKDADIDALAGACQRAVVCRRLGWCTLLSADGNMSKSLGESNCSAANCATAEVCTRFGACKLVDGLCVIAPPPPEPTCQIERVVDLSATASSARSDSGAVKFGGDMAVDRDSRTAWVPDTAEAESGQLTITLPKSRKVVAVELHGGSDRNDALGGWVYLFERPMAYYVTVGGQRHMAYVARWMAPVTNRARLAIPATQTDTITVELVMNTWPELERSPALTEVRVFACVEP